MNECKIVQDLLPLYAEDLISHETKVFVDTHCAGCEECGNQKKRCIVDLPAPEEDAKAYKKALRKNQLNLICRAVLLFIAVVMILYMGCTKLEAYMQWKNGRVPVEQIVEAPYGNGKVTLVDWEASGESYGLLNPEGTLIYIEQQHYREDEYGYGWTITEGGYAKHWENVQVEWSPNGVNILMTADLIEGGNGIYIETYKHWYDEEGRCFAESKLLPEGSENGFVDVLTAHCKETADFPTGWETITFTFLAWKDDSETLVFVYETDNGHRGLLDFHYPSETITDMD